MLNNFFEKKVRSFEQICASVSYWFGLISGKLIEKAKVQNPWKSCKIATTLNAVQSIKKALRSLYRHFNQNLKQIWKIGCILVDQFFCIELVVASSFEQKAEKTNHEN